MAAFWLMAARSAPGQPSNTAEIVTLHQLKSLTPAEAAAGPPVRVRGVVVCYDAGWHQLYINDGHETLYFDADQFADQPQKADFAKNRPVLLLLSGARSFLGFPYKSLFLNNNHNNQVVGCCCARRFTKIKIRVKRVE